MRKTQSIEIVGIGNFNIYPITIKEQEYNKVNQNNKPIFKKEIEKGTQAKYIYVDDTGTEYSKDRVFTEFNGLVIQAIKRTEQVKKFELCDKAEYLNLTEMSISFLDTDKTTNMVFDEKIKDKAICFKLKKSSVGFNFYRAYIMKLNDCLIMVSGKGNLNQATEDFKELIANREQKESSEIVIQKVEVNADDIENLIQI